MYYTGIDFGECVNLATKVYTVRMALQEVQDPVIDDFWGVELSELFKKRGVTDSIEVKDNNNDIRVISEERCDGIND